MRLIIIFLSLFYTFIYANTNNDMQLTVEEQNYINNNKIIIGTEHWKPIVYKNKHTKKLDGIVGDLLNVAITNLGLDTVVISGKWKDILNQFKAKKIDLLPAVYYTKQREKFGYYSKKFFSLSEYIYVKNTNNTIKDFDDLKGKKLAIIKGYAMIDMVHKRFPSVKIIQTKDLEESINFVIEGKVDALIDGQIIVENYIYDNLVLDLKGIPQTAFKPNGVYLLSNIDKPILKSILQKGLDSISKTKKNEIIKKWLQKPDNQDFLNLQDKQYLKEHPIIKMCNNPNWEPIEFARNGNMNNMQGIVIDTLALLEKELKVKFVNVPTKSWTQSQLFLKQKRCDILPAAIKTNQRLKYAIFTKPYLDYKLAIITKKDKPFINSIDDIVSKSIARKKGSGLIHKLQSKYPNINIIQTKDYLEALRKVSTGEVYCTIATLPVASYYINQFAINNLQVAGYIDMHYKLAIAVRDDKIKLRDILQKSLNTLTKKDIEKINNKWTITNIEEKFDFKFMIKIILVIVVLLILLSYRQYLLKKANKDLLQAVDNQTKNLQELNETLEQRIDEEVKINLKIQEQLFKSEKLASMGEMIGNIAHQWRQPLSSISTLSTGMILQKECGILSDDKFIENCNTINQNAQYLSKTIDDFRNFIKGDKEKKEFSIINNINSFLSLVNSTKRDNNIEVILNLTDDIKIYGYENELIQCLINIFNNAKDIFKEKDIEQRFVFITTNIEDNNLSIEIKDNAGGIPEDIISKVFEPYFTTKHESQGTGLGLHMTYNLVVNGMDGDIIVENIKYQYDGKDYIGASFKIILPLRKELEC